MEAKDTVMNPEQLKEAWLKACEENTKLDVLNYPLVISEAQAEISFKAGRKEAASIRDAGWIKWLKEHNCACELCNLPLGYNFVLTEDDYWKAIGDPNADNK